ncbi:MAG: bacteriohemerythrin [Trichlorobacter sp.]
MPLIEWNKELILGFDQIDAHHQQLVNLLNKAHDSFVQGVQPGTIDATLTELADYADYHFAVEEQLMRQQNYPDLAAHQQDHATFRSKVLEMRHSCSKETLPAQLEITVFLLEWLVMHIKITDRKSLVRQTA